MISWLFLGIGIMGWKKTEEKVEGMTWIAITIMLITCYQVFGAGLIGLIHLPIDLVTMGILDLLGGLYFWYHILRTKEWQRYHFDLADLAFCGIAAVALYYFMQARYGLDLSRLAFSTIDPSNHMSAALDVINNKKVQNMYYSAFENGMLLSVFGSFVAKSEWYRIFCLTEVYHLFLSGLLFYALIRRYMRDHFLKMAGLILTFAYAYGYPLCSAIYGFVYLGLGITGIILILILTEIYVRKEVKTQPYMVLIFLAFACYGLFEGYVMFMPVTYFAVITAIWIHQYQEKELISWNTVKVCLSVFLLPCILGLYYTYRGIFASRGLTVAGQLQEEGACYRDLFSNFLIFIPLALFGIWQLIRKRENRVNLYLTVYEGIFTLALFVGGMKQSVSSYYYYKNYFLIWLLVLYLVMQGIAAIQKESRVMIAGQGAVLVFVFYLLFSDAEAKVKLHNENFVWEPRTYQLQDLYSKNYLFLRYDNGLYDAKKLELYRYVNQKLKDKTDELIPICSNWQDCFWYQAITDQKFEGYEYNGTEFKKTIRKMEKDGAYIVVLKEDPKENPMYQKEHKYFESLEKVYENEAGFVAELP